jgi:hypothetical protein
VFPRGCYIFEIGEELSHLDAEMDAFFPFVAFIRVLLIQICDQFTPASAELQYKGVFSFIERNR